MPRTNNFTFDIKYSKVGIAEFLIHLTIMSALDITLQSHEVIFKYQQSRIVLKCLSTSDRQESGVWSSIAYRR